MFKARLWRKPRNGSRGRPNLDLRKLLVIGHGELALRQQPTYEHWLNENVEVHCADVSAARLDDCLDGIKRYVLPDDEARLLRAAPFDYLFINNVPDLHLASALQYGTYAKSIIIQKPQVCRFSRNGRASAPR